MFENLSIGLDIATAISVIAAATAFIWNSVLSNKRERNERRKDVIKAHVYKIADKIMDDTNVIFKETRKVRDQIQNEGATSMNLNYWQSLYYGLPNTFQLLNPLDEVYADGRFKKLAPEFKNELDVFFESFIATTESGEKWDFDKTFNKPNEIAIHYITRLYQETEKYFETL